MTGRGSEAEGSAFLIERNENLTRDEVLSLLNANEEEGKSELSLVNADEEERKASSF